MPEIFYSDEHVTLWHGDALTVLASMPDQSVDCIVTGPPYLSLRTRLLQGALIEGDTP